jgi:hypothetical protein
MALWQERPQPLHLRVRQHGEIAHLPPYCGSSHRAAAGCSSRFIGPEQRQVRKAHTAGHPVHGFGHCFGPAAGRPAPPARLQLPFGWVSGQPEMTPPPEFPATPRDDPEAVGVDLARPVANSLPARTPGFDPDGFRRTRDAGRPDPDHGSSARSPGPAILRDPGFVRFRQGLWLMNAKMQGEARSDFRAGRSGRGSAMPPAGTPPPCPIRSRACARPHCAPSRLRSSCPRNRRPKHSVRGWSWPPQGVATKPPTACAAASGW